MKLYAEYPPICSGGSLRDLVRNCETKVREEVHNWEPNKILSVGETYLVDYLVEEYKLDTPGLLTEKKFIEDHGETTIEIRDPMRHGVAVSNVPGSYFTVAIPFEGNPELLELRPSEWSGAPPSGRIKDSSILLFIRSENLDPNQTSQDVETAEQGLAQYVRLIRNECDDWNGRIRSMAEDCIRSRKKRLLDHNNLLNALNLPVRKRSDFDRVIAFPVAQRKRLNPIPPTLSEFFKPEPGITDPDYEQILETIDRLSQTIERSPSTWPLLN